MDYFLLAIGNPSKCASSGCPNAPCQSVTLNEHDTAIDMRFLACEKCVGGIVTRCAAENKWRVTVDPYTPPRMPPASPETLAELRKTHEIYSVGDTPEKAIGSLGLKLEWGIIADIRDLAGGAEEFDWGRRFTAGGAGMKAAGWHVPGGVVLSWWK